MWHPSAPRGNHANQTLTMFQQPAGADGEAAGETTQRNDTQLLTMATDMPPSKMGSLDSVLSQGVAFVDNSGSTTGSILRNCESFINTLRPSCTALWNSRCGKLARTDDVSWCSMGGTYPSRIYDEYDPLEPTHRGGFDWNCFTLVTDGQVSSSEVTKLAAHVHKTSHLPTILAVATVEVEDNHPVSRYNVSVLFAHFTAARSAIVVIIDGPLSRQNKVKVIAAKGEMANHPQLLDLPDLGSDPKMSQFPEMLLADLVQLQVVVYAPQPADSVLIGGGTHWLHLNALSQDTMGLWQVLEISSETEVEDIVRTYHAKGALGSLRHSLNQLSTSLTVEADQGVSSALNESTKSGVAGILAQLRFAETDAEKERLRAQLLSASGARAEVDSGAKDAAKKSLRSRRAMLGVALAAASVIERAGMGADVLGRLSNRASRASKIEPQALPSMSSLDLEDAIDEECIVMLDVGPSALLVRAVPSEIAEENTSDFGIDFALVAGNGSRNDVWLPDVIGISDNTADQIEATQRSAVTREETLVGIPIVSLASAENRKRVLQRLAVAFGAGIQLPSLWLVALSSIIMTLESKEWAGPDRAVGRLLHYFGGQIMQHVLLPTGHKFALTKEATVAQGLAQSIATPEFLEHHPLGGTVSAAAALIRWGGPTATPIEHYTNCVIARAHRCVPQEFLTWLKASTAVSTVASDSLPNTVTLWEAIFAVRAAPDGAVVPVAGSHTTVNSWNGVLSTESRLQLDRYTDVLAAQNGQTIGSCVGSTETIQSAINLGADSLITPGTTMVVRAVLSELTTPHLSSSVAVERVRRFHNICAAEFEPNTIGTASVDDTMNALAKWLLWARAPMVPLPPFATPYGPSVFFFYHNRTRGGHVTNMVEGFEWNQDTPGNTNEEESQENRMLRLTEFIRTVRARLLHSEYQANLDGSFNRHTVNIPLHRHMRDEWSRNETADPTSGQFISDTAARIMAAKTGNLHTENLEHDIAMLAPSLIQAGRLDSAVDAIPLVLRVETELRHRTTDQIDAADAPAAIWVPREDPDLMQRLAESSKAGRESVRAAALLVSAQHRAGGPGLALKKVVIKKNKDKLGRFLCKVLRHEAVQRGITMRPDGYVRVDEVMGLADLSENLVEEMIEVVEADSKNRFKMLELDGELLIRCNQGHSLPIVNSALLMHQITDSAEVPVCIHGTYEEAWRVIETTALDKMGRNQINMAVGLPGDPEVTSGVRNNIEVLIYIDVARAMAAGIPFFRSANNVICSPGPIPPHCFAHVVRLRDNATLYEPDWRE